MEFRALRKDTILVELETCLKNEYSVVKIGHDTAENEPLKVCQELAQSQNRVRTHTQKSFGVRWTSRSTWFTRRPWRDGARRTDSEPGRGGALYRKMHLSIAKAHFQIKRCAFYVRMHISAANKHFSSLAKRF